MRQKRVADVVMRELSFIIQRRINDPRLEGVTITGVNITPDFKYADIHFYRLGGDPDSLQEAMNGFESANGFLRRELASLLTIRQTPELRFHLDDSITYGEHIDTLLAQIEQERLTNGEQDSHKDSTTDLSV